MVLGNKLRCEGCGIEVVSCKEPAYCFNCDPETLRIKEAAKFYGSERPVKDPNHIPDESSPMLEAHAQAVKQYGIAPLLSEKQRKMFIDGIEKWGRGIAKHFSELNKPQRITADEYQQLAARTICDQAKALERLGGPEAHSAEGPFPSLMPVQWNHSLIGIQNEAGELAKQLQDWIYYGKKLDRTHVAEEYGDLLWYIAEGLTALNLSFQDVMEANLRKLQARYPEKYTDEQAKSRNVAAEREAIEQDGHGFGHHDTLGEDQ